VQSWINSPTTNFGIILAGPNNSDTLLFASSEASTRTNRPRLEVTYR
jgi:hypothetical protein